MISEFVSVYLPQERRKAGFYINPPGTRVVQYCRGSSRSITELATARQQLHKVRPSLPRLRWAKTQARHAWFIDVVGLAKIS